jgi:hypothetical protein
MTASHQSHTEPSRAKPEDIHCPPMSHQNSGNHGHEMYPQQFVRLVGCHNAPSPGLRKRQDEKLH